MSLWSILSNVRSEGVGCEKKETCNQIAHVTNTVGDLSISCKLVVSCHLSTVSRLGEFEICYVIQGEFRKCVKIKRSQFN